MQYRQKSKLIRSRGSVEDWAPEREPENLAKKEAYSKKMARQEEEGEPDLQESLEQESLEDGTKG